MRSRRGLATLAIACIVHMLAFGVVRSLRPRPATPAAPPEAVSLVELSEVPLEPEPAPAAPSDPRAQEPARPLAMARAERASEAPTAEPPAERHGTSDPGPAASATSTADPGWHVQVFGAPEARGSAKVEGPLGVPGVAREALSGPAPASSTFGLREGLAKHDTEVGITRGGFVRTAVEAAIHSDVAPASGTARYDVRVLRDGTTVISLEQASRDHDGFAALTGTIRKHVDPKKLRLPDGAKGLHVVIDVDIHDQYPDGRKPSDVGKVVAYVGPGEYDITKDGFIVRKMPGASVGFTGKVCSGGVYVGPAGLGLQGGCSFVNAGMPSRRMASARVVSEALL